MRPIKATSVSDYWEIFLTKRRFFHHRINYHFRNTNKNANLYDLQDTRICRILQKKYKDELNHQSPHSSDIDMETNRQVGEVCMYCNEHNPRSRIRFGSI